MASRITTIIVTYRSEDTIGDCLAAQRPAHDAGLLDAVVVENDSGDRTPEIVRRDHPWATLVETGANLGYGRGCNAGLPHVQTEYLAFMNSDVAFGVDAVRALLDFMDAHPAAGICGPAIERAAGDYQTIVPLPTPGRLVREALGRRGPAPQPILPDSAPQRTDWVCGALLICRTALVQRLGGFDPRFFLYFEETDLCVRAAAAGAELWAVGSAVAHHASNASARKVDPSLADGGCLSEHFYRSRYYYLAKHHGWLPATLAEVTELVVKGARDVARRLTGRVRPSELAARLRGPVLRFPARVSA